MIPKAYYVLLLEGGEQMRLTFTVKSILCRNLHEVRIFIHSQLEDLANQ